MNELLRELKAAIKKDTSLFKQFEGQGVELLLAKDIRFAHFTMFVVTKGEHKLLHTYTLLSPQEVVNLVKLHKIIDTTKKG